MGKDISLRRSTHAKQPASPLGMLHEMQSRIRSASADHRIPVLLCDVSESMGWPIPNEHGTSLGLLKHALGVIAYQLPENAVAYWFHNHIGWFDPTETKGLTAEGSTDLAAAIRHIDRHQPTHIYLISDGVPDDEERAITEAAKLGCPFSSLFCGGTDNVQGIAFMKRLARETSGETASCDPSVSGTSAFISSVRELLRIPSS